MEKYEKIRIVGRGAYGIVHLCLRLSDKKPIIIKQIPVEQMTKEERQAALNEVKVLSMLAHPFIIEYYENFLEDKALMIVMEYAQGGTLFEFLQQRNGNLIEEEEILHYFAQMALSLHHVHTKQILHRDLKTQNILLDKKKRTIKIGDFGISKVLSSKSKAFSVVGTPCYISPELCEGKPYNQKSDIWALGCVLYELTSLKRTFEAANLPALILKIMRGTFSPISDFYSQELQALILSMLHLDPSRRPHINQVMAQPIVINTIMNLHTDMGKIPCTRIHRPLSSLPSSSRSRLSIRGANMSSKEHSLHACTKPPVLGHVFCWGGGIQSPVKMPLPNVDTHVLQVATGRMQRAAVTRNGRLFVWEAAGVGDIPGSIDGQTAAFIPRYLEGQSAVAIQHVSCGDLFTACLTDRGILMTFGSGLNGSLGHGNYNDVSQAKIVESLLGYEVVQMSCGASHVLAVTNEHEVFAWGRGDNGRLGLGNQDSFCSPQPVPIPEGFRPQSVHCGVDCSMLLTVNNKLLCCGSNRYNKLGMDNIATETSTGKSVEEVLKFSPVASHPLYLQAIRSVSMGISHTALITTTGDCFMFGSGQFGQLGVEGSTSTRRPQLLYLDHPGSKFNMVGCGDTFTVAVTHNDEIYSWGKNSRGRLGRPGGDSRLPHRVILPGPDQFSITSISCSHGNTLLATKPVPRDDGQMD